jgi:peptidoglycan hydrolase-like protein with peptidoglycan-binding domain
VPPKEPGSGLLQGHDGFASVRKGKALRLGSQGPAVVALQVMLLSWNYPLAIADVTGKYDEKTATAVFHYRLDNGISESKGGGPQGFDKQARAEGIFDQAALQAFEGRMGAEKQRAIREIDPRRGVRFQVRGTPSAAAVLAALFDEEELARIGKPEAAVTLEKPNEAGESAAWISLRAFGCGRSTQVPPVECAGEK